MLTEEFASRFGDPNFYSDKVLSTRYNRFVYGNGFKGTNIVDNHSRLKFKYQVVPLPEHIQSRGAMQAYVCAQETPQGYNPCITHFSCPIENDRDDHTDDVSDDELTDEGLKRKKEYWFKLKNNIVDYNRDGYGEMIEVKYLCDDED